MKIKLSEKIGLISDSHSNNINLLAAIKLLRENGADTILHLGDFCDSLKPETMDESVEIFLENDVMVVLGNNEYIIKTEFILNNPGRLKEQTVSFVNNLPYNIIIDEYCFTHSLPYEWPAATRQPIEGLIIFPFVGDLLPFRIMFRGHSHTMSVMEYIDEKRVICAVRSDGTVHLLGDRKYIITVGALEDGFCALFNTVNEEFHSLSIIKENRRM